MDASAQMKMLQAGLQEDPIAGALEGFMSHTSHNKPAQDVWEQGGGPACHSSHYVITR